MHRSFIFLALFTIIQTIAPAQEPGRSFDPEKNRALRFMFYNVENAFDTLKNPNANDKEYLAGGVRHWDSYKYYKKIKSIYKVIVAAGGWEPPELIGLCEVENGKVLKDITRNTPLSKYEYNFIHKNSPDHRGIDVALLYNPKKFIPDLKKFIPVNLPENYSDTREILYVRGQTKNSDTLHIFINHWPSKWGGELETDPKRALAAKTLRTEVDSVFNTNKNARIIITGDFNDIPSKASLSKHLKAQMPEQTFKPGMLYNLSALWSGSTMGTHKYQGKWSVIDQFIVSGSLLNNEEGLTTKPSGAYIFSHPPLLEKDNKHPGKKPNRTYVGYRYHGGYSDHLPIVLDLE